MNKNFKHIITSTPYRISLGGGGTDLPFYYSKKGGYLITAAIDQYLHVNVAERKLDDKIFLQYSNTEWANNIEDIQHDIIKNILKFYNINKGIQIGTFSSMPTYTGLGASSSLVVGLVNAFSVLKNIKTNKIKIAETAYHIERVLMGLEGGYQDQYIASLGGVQEMKISKNGFVKCRKLKISDTSLKNIQEGLMLVHTNIDRSSKEIIKAQFKSRNATECYDEIKKIGISSANYLIEGDIESLGLAMDKHWLIKKEITKVMSNSVLDEIYIKLKQAGSNGGKIIGAGGGGFFLMSVLNKKLFTEKIAELGLRSIPFKFENRGSHLLHSQVS